MTQNLAILFSGGKDSNYVTYLAKQTNNNVSCLITLSSKNPNSYMFQSVGNEIIKVQAKSMNIPLLEYQTEGEKEKELEDLKSALKLAKEKYNIEGVCSGAIKSAYQSSRIQDICKQLDLFCYNPIWQIDEDEYMDKLLENNFEISIFGIFSYPFEKTLLGKTINQNQLNKLKQLRSEFEISIAGEGGEYESFILDSPLFSQKIQIKQFNSKMDSENSGIITNCKVELIKKENQNKINKVLTNQNNKDKINNEKNEEILVINLNKKENKLYELEYVKPITQIIQSQNKTFKVLNYIDLNDKIITKYNKIILSGTPLKEFEYLKHLDKFNWIKQKENSNKHILGICAGCQIIQKIFGANEINFSEIGLKNPEILIQDKILNRESLKEIYTLHSKSFQIPKEFEIIAKTSIPQIIKYNNIYGTLFHPEVRNHQIITNFLNF